MNLEPPGRAGASDAAEVEAPDEPEPPTVLQRDHHAIDAAADVAMPRGLRELDEPTQIGVERRVG